MNNYQRLLEIRKLMQPFKDGDLAARRIKPLAAQFVLDNIEVLMERERLDAAMARVSSNIADFFVQLSDDQSEPRLLSGKVEQPLIAVGENWEP